MQDTQIARSALREGVSYLVQWTDEPEPFWAVFVVEDRGFLCFRFTGRMIVARPANIKILK